MAKTHRNTTPPTAPTRFGHRPSNHKELRLGSHRVVPLEETFERAVAKAEVMGLTRLSDITDLDNLRVPNYAAVCPGINYPPRPGGISVFSGKGVTRLHAKVSALMEAVERYSCLQHNRFTIRGSYQQLVRSHNIAHPSSFVVPRSYEYEDHQATEWVFARSLLHGDLVLVPAWLVFCPYLPGEASLQSWATSTNGLASGNTLEEATLHALYEAIERDAEAIALHSRRARSLNFDSAVPDAAREFASRFDAEHVKIEVKDITQDIKVPTFITTIVDYSLRSINYINGGKGTHLDPEVALLRAMTEACQSRVTGMTGIREDMTDKRARMVTQDFDTMLEAAAVWCEPSGERCSLDAIPNRATDSIVDDIEIVLDELRHAGLDDVYLVDLTCSELEIPVARVLAPGLEFEVEGNWVGTRLAPFFHEGTKKNSKNNGRGDKASPELTLEQESDRSPNTRPEAEPAETVPMGKRSSERARSDSPKTRIYLGPTLSVEDASQILEAEYFPPITHDDLPLALDEGVDVVGIVDAAFIQTYTATPTQILDCLRRGVVIFGAASAGALRAVETDRFGMQGVGGIYRLFKSGFEPEDELAVSYDPEGRRALSLAMINARYALGEALKAGTITQSSHDTLLTTAKSIYFPHRTWSMIFRNADGVEENEITQLRGYLDDQGNALDWKRQDAIECLQTIRSYLGQRSDRGQALSGGAAANLVPPS